jgi:hypothetical protein
MNMVSRSWIGRKLIFNITLNPDMVGAGFVFFMGTSFNFLLAFFKYFIIFKKVCR